MTLVRPDFVEKEGHELTGLYCKRCGVKIAGLSERVKDIKIDRQGNRHEIRTARFTRFHNFSELKMSLDDGSAHITTGCDQCLTMGLSLDELNELMEADIEEQRLDMSKELADKLISRVPTGIVGIKAGGGIA